MTRSVADAAVLLGALAGSDPRDAATSAATGKTAPDYRSFLDRNGLRGKRIGIVRTKLFGYSPEADALVEAAFDVLRKEGAVLVDPVAVPHLGEYDDAEFEVLLYEFKADLNAYLAELQGARVRSLEELIAFNVTNRQSEMPYFGQDLFEKSQAKGPLSDKAYIEAREKCVKLGREEGLNAALRDQKLDAFLAPSCSPAWPIDLVNGDHYIGSSSTPPAVAGLPNITVPVGYAFGLPVGMSLFGAAWTEGNLIAMAYAYEQAAELRRPPRFLPTAELPA
jgi:amidase